MIFKESESIDTEKQLDEPEETAIEETRSLSNQDGSYYSYEDEKD